MGTNTPHSFNDRLSEYNSYNSYIRRRNRIIENRSGDDMIEPITPATNMKKPDNEKNFNFTYMKPKTKLEIFWTSIKDQKILLILTRFFLVSALVFFILFLLSLILLIFLKPTNGEIPLYMLIPMITCGISLGLALLFWLFSSIKEITFDLWKWVLRG